MATDYIWQLGDVELVAGSEIAIEFAVYNEFNGALDLSSSTIMFVITPVGQHMKEVVVKQGADDGVVYSAEYSEDTITSSIITVNMKYADTINLDGAYIMQLSLLDSKNKYHPAGIGYLYITSAYNFLEQANVLKEEA